MNGTTKVPANTIKPGDTILPPARELSLWMRRNAAERGLSESDLTMTVTEVRDGQPDQRGPWVWIRAEMSAAWNAGNKSLPWVFKARPSTMWPVVQR